METRMKIVKQLLIAALASFALSAQAEEKESADVAALRAKLASDMPTMPVDSIKESPLPGVLEVTSGARLFYLTPDAKYMLQGSIFDVVNRVDITAAARGKLQLKAVNAIGEENMLVYAGKEGGELAGRTMTVFTDTTCPYCQKLHEEIGKLTDEGVKVRYLLYPRAGLKSPAAQQLESVWCADNPQQAMTDAKAGKEIESKTCDNPITQHVQVAHDVGLRGTPLIYLDDGTVIPGYRPADGLLGQLRGEVQAAAN
jgi:thiol:disulfide interchange protein DsbC